MDGFNAVSSRVRARLAGLAGWLYGCSHRRTTFPITLRTNIPVGGQPGAQSETYVVCLECGRHFAYDWTTMRLTRHRAARARGRLECGGRSGLHREGKASRGLQ